LRNTREEWPIPIIYSRHAKEIVRLSRETVWRIINEAAKACGVEGPIGTHTMRKTFGYHFYQQTKDVAMLQQIFGHSAPSITLRYIGINDDLIDNVLKNFSL